jgi:hypothetical protein
MNRNRRRYSSTIALVVTLLFALSCLTLPSCGGSSSAATDPQIDYNAAVQDAKTMTPAKISKNLTAIRPDNPNLRWENDVPGSRVLVATWVGNQSACESYHNPDTPGCKASEECPTYWYNSWVTVAPELKSLVGSTPTLLRVAQALGLPPPSSTQTLDNTCVIEFYVSPTNIFRPSSDPEVTDQEAELTFPTDGFRKFDDSVLVYSEMPCDTSRCTSCTPSGKCGMTSYRNWFDNRREYVYSKTDVNDPYPWTGLGYTYDWGNPAAPHIGVSEFVINAGSNGVPVFIKSAQWTRSYFNN